MAGEVDLLFYAITTLSLLFSLGVVVAIVYFAVKYRRNSRADRTGAALIHGSLKLELSWIIIPLFLALGIFLWSAWLYFRLYTPPADSFDIYVTGKQWMWKFQHPTGQREINTLHVPVNRPIRLIMTSQDVIHSFYVPAFRIKQDVIPGRVTVAWFEATETGDFHLFCAEYCGSLHSEMIGQVIVMDPSDYEAWLGGAGTVAVGPGESLAEGGELLFNRLGCSGCHRPDGTGVGPSLVGVFGSQVKLESGEVVTADEAYMVDSILNPNAQIVAGYDPIMPTFEGVVDEQELLRLVAYLKSIGQEAETTEEGGDQGTQP